MLEFILRPVFEIIVEVLVYYIFLFWLKTGIIIAETVTPGGRDMERYVSVFKNAFIPDDESGNKKAGSGKYRQNRDSEERIKNGFTCTMLLLLGFAFWAILILAVYCLITGRPGPA